MSFNNPAKINSVSALWREFCSVVWMRKKLASSLFSLIVLSGLSVMAQMTPLYESSIKILVNQETVPDENIGEGTAANQLASEIELLKNRELLTNVAQQTGSNDELFIQQFSTRLWVQEVNRSNVIKVTYRDEIPERSAQVLNLLFGQYVKQREYLNDIANPENVEATLSGRAKELAQKSEDATSALNQLDSAYELTGIATRQDLVLKQFFELQKRAETADIEKREAQEQIIALKSQLVNEPEQLEVGTATKYVQALDKMKEELVGFEMQRTQLLQKYQPQHRLIRDIDQRIAKSKELITKEEKNPPRERTFAINQTRRRLKDDLFKAEASLAMLVQREAKLRELVNVYQSRVSALNLQGVKKDRLERERASNQEAVTLYRQKAQEAEINAIVKKSKLTQVSLLEDANIARYPVSPNWSRNLTLLLLAGLGTSLGSVLIAETFRPRVCSEEGLHRRLGLAVLAKLPAPVKFEI
jgi:uncharacterized protein involved in exopolysaccharide biosynthesis